MAKLRNDITNLEAQVPARKPGRKATWEQWMDGSVYELVKGKDFKNQKTARSAFAAKARRRGGRGVTRVTSSGNVLVQFVPGTTSDAFRVVS